ncbi:unnamed protein product, partial [Vitis vinifera]
MQPEINKDYCEHNERNGLKRNKN